MALSFVDLGNSDWALDDAPADGYAVLIDDEVFIDTEAQSGATIIVEDGQVFLDFGNGNGNGNGGGNGGGPEPPVITPCPVKGHVAVGGP